jgi:hypothetical protein
MSMKPFVPTKEQRENVEAMTGFGIPQEEIARLIKNPETGKSIDDDTLRLRFSEEIATGLTKVKANVGRFIYASIMGLPGGITHEPSRAHLAEFFADRRMGWSQKSIHEHTGKDGSPLDNSIHIISAALDKIAERIAGDANGGALKAGAGGDPPASEPGTDS